MLTLTSPVETPLHRVPAGVKLAALAVYTVALFALTTPAATARANNTSTAVRRSGWIAFAK